MKREGAAGNAAPDSLTGSIERLVKQLLGIRGVFIGNTSLLLDEEI